MKVKILILFSLLNIVFISGTYALLFRPLCNENSQITLEEIKLNSILEEHEKSVAILSRSLEKTKPNKRPTMNQLTKIILKLAKKQFLNVKQIEPINANNISKQSLGLSIQTSGSYQNSVKFIFDVNQLPFLLHWPTIILSRDKEIELTLVINENPILLGTS